ncbi:MAG TPA: fibronectin type III domain-containing protein [Mycobacteriales bacterium]|nr:fibronectin type III domain-containing protein [Mycobacteriales bacterium]
MVTITGHTRPSARVAALIALALVAGGVAAPVAAAEIRPTRLAASPPGPAPGTIVVLNHAPSAITTYSAHASGAAAPLTRIAGARTELAGATDLAVTASGMVWVSIPTHNLLAEYAGRTTGNVRPVATIAGAKTRLHSPVALAVDPAGNVWVLNDSVSDGSASVLEFAAGANGNVAPLRRIAGRRTRLFPAGGIAIAGASVWVTHVEGGSGLPAPALQRFPATGTGNLSANRVISGSRTTLDYPAALTVDRAGGLTVASDPDRHHASAMVSFAPGAVGNVAPVRRIVGSRTALAEPGFPGLDAKARVWVPDATHTRIVRFGAATDGNVAPAVTIAGAATRLHAPRGVAVWRVPPSAPRGVSAVEVARHRVQISWRPPRRTGGGLEGYVVIRRQGTLGEVHRRAVGVGRTLTTGRLPRHHRYTFTVRAVNDAGTSGESGAISVHVH